MTQRKLKLIRKEMGLSQSDLAEVLSIDVSSYCRKENGKTRIHDNEWKKLAKVLNVSVDQIKGPGKSRLSYHENLINKGDIEFDFSETDRPVSISENLKNYIACLKKENESLKDELGKLKSTDKSSEGVEQVMKKTGF
ncbi:helix-turn-helix transcriptional regulator [uncultured Chryseobacterium sp.]|uniref:helix-turn-helix transcriptional regulator n=1 Tax=uncultured Chryseobacterium sp. TaxID=259322 RepID=UPI0025DF49B3|nr:helix-turn-helix transcriptional regulator [uncultured Chryseobacterium sp.]